MSPTVATSLQAALSALPTVVAGVEYLYKESSSTSKQQLALDSLTVLTATAGAADPAIAPVASELNAVLSSLINLTVAGFNATGLFTHKAPATPGAAPVAA